MERPVNTFVVRVGDSGVSKVVGEAAEVAKCIFEFLFL